MTIGLIIPTINRHREISTLLQSLLLQKRLPDEIIIVDQNHNDLTKQQVFTDLSSVSERIHYIHDCSFSGLVQAKEKGFLQSKADIICFLDDDVKLDSNYFFAIENGFMSQERMLGCSGFITNLPKHSYIFLLLHSWCYRGIFTDMRQQIIAKKDTSSGGFVHCNLLSGGASCFRRIVLEHIPFDKNGMHYFEDTDFSTRAALKFGKNFYINFNAQLVHFMDQDTRPNAQHLLKRKIIDAFIFYLKRKHIKFAWFDMLSVLLWWFMQALLLSFKQLSFAPIVGFVCGIVAGINKKIIL